MQFRLSQGGSDVGVSDVAHGRVSIGNSSRDPKPTDPGGLVFNKIAKDAICIITNNANTAAEPQPERSPGDLRRRRAPLERRSGRDSRQQHDRRVRPHRGFGHAGCVPEDLHGAEARRQLDRQAVGVERARPADGEERQGRRSATCRCSSPRAPTRSPTRASPAPSGTRSPASTAGCGTSGWSPRATSPRRAIAVHPLGPEQQCGAEDHRNAVGSASLGQ